MKTAPDKRCFLGLELVCLHLLSESLHTSSSLNHQKPHLMILYVTGTLAVKGAKDSD